MTADGVWENFVLPKPYVDKKEQELLEQLTERYEKLIAPGPIKKLETKVKEKLPEKVVDLSDEAIKELREKEIYTEALKIISTGFKAIQEQLAKYSISKSAAIKRVNNISSENEITSLEQFCLVRAYDLRSRADSDKIINYGTTIVEGAATGIPGFAGIPANLVISTLLYFRAVQKVAISYGYDIKNDPDELEIAGQVFAYSMGGNAESTSGEMGSLITKIMVMSELSAVKQTATKTWADMAARGGATLILAQMRALAHKSAEAALNKAGKKGLENTVFRTAFEQIGRRLSLNAVRRSVPVVSGIIGAAFDTGQMKRVMEFADVFYCKRFILEKETSINRLIGVEPCEVYEYEEIVDQESQAEEK